MKIIILSLAAGLNEMLSSHLSKIGFTAQTIDYARPLKPQLEDADVLINGLGKVDRSIVDACPKLKLVHQVGTGVDNVDVDYCRSRSIFVANVPKANSIAVAEHTLYLMTYMAKNMKSAGKGLMARRVLNVLGSELYGKTLLIVGLGYIGTEVAKRAKAFGMKIIAVTKHPEEKRRRKSLNTIITSAATKTTTSLLLLLLSNSGINNAILISTDSKGMPSMLDDDNNNNNMAVEVKGANELLSCLPRADYVSLHTNLNDETRGLIGEKEFQFMKRSAHLINVARAQIVDRDALYEVLSEDKIAGAAFDVFWEEPANPEDPLLQLENFTLTPHIAGWTKESANVAAELITTNIERISCGKVPLATVNLSL